MKAQGEGVKLYNGGKFEDGDLETWKREEWAIVYRSLEFNFPVPCL